jgi:predicted ArsR family transcriptional regulator
VTYLNSRFSAYIRSVRKKNPASGAHKKGHFGSRRAEIVKLLQGGVNTVLDLASRTGLTDNAVRSHLLALERNGLVHRRDSRPGKRRPHDLYQLTSRAQKLLIQASDASLNALLTVMKANLSAKQLRKLLRDGGTSLAVRFATNGAGKPLRARVQNAARLLNALGGTARIEKDEGRFYIRSQGCPLNAVVAEHPETCLMVETFLSRAIHAPVHEQCERGAQSRCRFVVAANDTRDHA